MASEADKLKEAIIQKAVALNASIIAGDYRMPKEMTWFLNQLEDAVTKFQMKYPANAKQYMLPKDLKFIEKCRKEREDFVRRLAEQEGLSNDKEW